MAKSKLIIVGASGHAKVIIDVFEQMGNYQILGLFDDRFSKGEKVLGYELLGNTESISNFLSKHEGVKVFIAIGDNWTRSKVKHRLEQDVPEISWANAIHPGSHTGKATVLGKGIAVLAGAVINSQAKIGDFAIMGSNCNLDHDSHLGVFASLAPGSTVGGNVQIGKYAAIGLGANIINGLSIGDHTVIGAGATVLQNFGDYLIAYGSPAKIVRARKEGEQYL